jgi:hypothetical protein
MFDKYIVCEEGFRARDDGRPGGVVEVRMPYYRGLGLSMVEAVDLVVDGTPVPPAPGEHDIAVSVRLRISYMPVPGGGRDSKRLVLSGRN